MAEKYQKLVKKQQNTKKGNRKSEYY